MYKHTCEYRMSLNEIISYYNILMQNMYNEIVCISESVQCTFRLFIMSDIIIFCLYCISEHI